jgi:hypothetical protein
MPQAEGRHAEADVFDVQPMACRLRPAACVMLDGEMPVAAYR